MTTPKSPTPPTLPSAASLPPLLVADERDDSEVVRAWLAKYGRSLAQGILLGLAIAMGWHYYQQHQATQALNASAQFDRLLKAIAAEPPAADSPEANVVRDLALNLTENYGQTAYAVLTDLLVARTAVLAQDYPAAERHLQRVIDSRLDPVMGMLANLRLAQVEVARENFDGALTRLTLVTDPAFAPLVNELRGDILFLQNDFAAAKTAYEAAIPVGSTPSPSLQARLDAVASKLAPLTHTIALSRLPTVPEETAGAAATETPVTTITLPDMDAPTADASPFWSPDEWMTPSIEAVPASVEVVPAPTEAAETVAPAAEVPAPPAEAVAPPAEAVAPPAEAVAPPAEATENGDKAP